MPESGFSSVFKSLSKSWRTGSTGSRKRSLPVTINPTVVGNEMVGKELQVTLKNGTTNEKVIAMRQLRESLSNVDVSSVPEVWYIVRGYITQGTNPQLRSETIRLLNTCISLSDDATPTKLSYYRDIVDNLQLGSRLDPDFLLFLNCLQTLTRKGKDVYSLFLYQDAPFCQYLLSLLQRIVNDRSNDDKQSVMELLDECLKFNFDLFDAASLKIILDTMLPLTANASDLPVLKSGLGMVGTLLSYGYVPPNSLDTVVTLLSWARMVDDDSVKEMALDDLSSLFCNPKVYYLTLSTVCDIIQEKGKGAAKLHKRQDICTIGCIRFIEFALFHYNEESSLGEHITNFMDNSVNYVFSCMIVAADRSEMHISIEVLKFVLKLLELPIIRQHHFSLAKRALMWKLLHELSLPQQPNYDESYKQNMMELCNKLQNLNNSDVYVSKTVQFMQDNAAILTPYNVHFVLRFYSQNLLCVYSAPDWEANCNELVDRYFGMCPREVYQVLLDACEATKYVTTDESASKVYGDVFVKCLCQTIVKLDSSFIIPLTDLVQDFPQSALEEFMERIFLEIEKATPNSLDLAQLVVLLEIQLCQTLGYSSKANWLFKRMLPAATQSISTKNFAVFLVFARLFMSMRSTDDRKYLYFDVVTGIEGLCDTLGRNTDFITDQSVLQNAQWVYPENLYYYPEGKLATCSKYTLERSAPMIVGWCNICIDILDKFYTWEAFSFVLAHFCPQIANYALFSPEASSSVTKLIRLVCQEIQLKFTESFSIPDSRVTKTDVQVAFIRTLSSFTCYKSIMSRADEDQLINSTVFALRAWDKSGIPCLHFLIIATYEYSDSVKKFLPPILTILQTRTASPLTAGIILDFLLVLSFMPDLISNFSVDEFKGIFAIAFNFIQYSNENYSNKQWIALDPDDATDDHMPSSQIVVSHQLVMFSIAMAYNVIPMWFLKMSLEQRRKLAPYIIKGLIQRSKDNARDLAYIEFITRSTFARMAMRNKTTVEHTDPDSKHLQRSWLYGNGVATIRMHKVTGESDVTFRKATTVDQFNVRLQEELFPDHVLRMYESMVSDKNSESDEPPILFTPSFLMTEMMYPIQEERPVLKPIPLDDTDPTIKRAISILDRIPLVNFYKVGVVYVGPGQKKEDEILANRYGSKKYQEWLSEVGDIIRLRGCKKHYVGGLDRSDDIDGEYTVHYETEGSQLCFHVASMMPNNADDPHFNNKKRHIGNDYVKIYWNESGLPYSDIENVLSQFNLLNIVIEPVANTEYYLVRTYRKAGIPGIFSTSHLKLVSKENLARMIRHSAMNSSQFCDIWTNSDWEFSWESRMKQLKAIKEKNAKVSGEAFFQQFDKLSTSGKRDTEIYNRLEINSFN